jgi:hypothetical protein
MKYIDIKFEIDGIADVYQTIRLYDGCKLSEKEIVTGLNNGNIFTTLNTNGELSLLKDGVFTQLGRIVRSEIDGDLEYKYFEIDDNVKK